MPELTEDIKVETTATIDFSVYCGKCGAGLCGNTTVESRYGKHSITIDPCETCLENARDEGREEAKNEVAK